VLRNFMLLVVAFLSGGILMALEILGSRILAPSLGGSIFVWGSLISVFLAALSIGYYLGGRLVDRWPAPWLLAAVLAAAGVMVSLLPRGYPAILDWVVMKDLGDRVGPLVASTMLFFAPGVLMGMTSPFVIRLSAHSVDRAGRTAGAVYAVSTVGSIVGTLGSAFFLISYLHVSTIVGLLGYLLVATAVLTAAIRRPAQVAVVLALLAMGATMVTPAQAAEKILLERDSPYHRLFVTDVGNTRYLRADNVYHTEMDKRDPHGRGLPYSDYIDLAFLYNPQIRNVLVIGLGGGTVPKRFIRDYPNVSVDAVDIDPDVVTIAAKYFDVHPSARLKVYTADGRQFLRRSRKKYDLILLDAYYSDTVPFFLTTTEFFKIALDHLATGGVFVNNTIGAVSGPKSKFFRSVYRTMKEVMPQCHAYRVVESPSSFYNIEIFAVNAPQLVSIETIRQRAAQAQGKTIKDDQLVKRVDNYVTQAVKTNDVPTLSDDYAPVDALMHLW
jgi:spermidine synthase